MELLTAVIAYRFQASDCEGLETTGAESVNMVLEDLKKVEENGFEV